MKGLEIEYKYDITGYNYSDFLYRARKLKPINEFNTSGTDYFFSHTDKPTSFFRFRKGGDFRELTYKNKISKDNYVRTEINMRLHATEELEHVLPVLESVGYITTGRITKSCLVFEFKDHILVAYTVIDFETGTRSFLEIELKEDIDFKSKKTAMKRLNDLEKKYKKFGAKRGARVQESLYELYGHNL